MIDAKQPRVALLFPIQHVEAAAVLGRAFADDPLVRALIAPVDATDAIRRMTALFGSILKTHRKNSQPVVGVLNEGHVVAVGVVEHVQRPLSPATVMLQRLPLLPELMRALGGHGSVRAVSVLETLSRNRPPEPHIYLNNLGVEPSLQHHHCGSAILEFLKEQASLHPDLAGVYLETATEANVAYYRKFGYRVLNEIYPLGVRVLRMFQPRDREPSTTTSAPDPSPH